MAFVMDMTDTPFLETLLFERSWPLVATLAIGALALLWHGRARGDRRALRFAPVLSVAALLAWGLSTYVTTDREVLKGLTEKLVAATAPMDEMALLRMLEPEVIVYNLDGKVIAKDAERIGERLGQTLRIYSVSDHYVYRLDAKMLAADKGQTTFVVRSTLGSEFGDRPVRTEWLVVWAHNPDGHWRARSIQWLSLDGQDPPSALIFMMPRSN